VILPPLFSLCSAFAAVVAVNIVIVAYIVMAFYEDTDEEGPESTQRQTKKTDAAQKED
jgi:hypothetical protein